MTFTTQRIPVAGPWITEKERAYVADAVQNAWYDQANVYHERFESAFAQTVNRRYAMALPSCTSGLHLALAAAGIGPGDEVIVPDITWIATAAPIDYVGATPVFADIDPQSWCLSDQALAACITSRTRAVIAVDLYGNMPDMSAITRLCDEHGLMLIEDAAQAIGSRFQERPAGSFGRVSVFSFHGSKTLTTGEGGMLVTDDAALFERALTLRDHGRDTTSGKLFWNGEVGFKYKMSAMQAALGLAQLERLAELIARKRAIFGWYRERLGDVPGITLNQEADGVFNTYWMVTTLLDPALGWEKERLMAALKERGIDSRPFFYPLSAMPAYAGCPAAEAARQRNRVAYRLTPWGVNLPSALTLTADSVDRVCRELLQIIDGSGRTAR